MSRVRESEIGLADLIASVDRLRATDDALVRRIGDLLQVEAARPATARPAEPFELEPEETPQIRIGTAEVEYVHPPQSEFRPSTITHTRSETPAFAAPLPALPPATEEADGPALPFEPLFVPSWTRAILSLSLATPAEHGAVDMPRVVERLSRGQTIHRLPRRVVATMRKGVQVLVDRGSGMIPFLRDAEWLVREIVRVAGRETPVLHFRGLPSRGVADMRRKKRMPYEPPPAGVPVVLVTDFGIGVDELATDRATGGDWVEFLRMVRHTGSRIIAFVPYPRQRCPYGVADVATIVEWDRRTSLTRIRAAVRQGWSRR